jgi:hypothetical protein
MFILCPLNHYMPRAYDYRAKGSLSRFNRLVCYINTEEPGCPEGHHMTAHLLEIPAEGLFSIVNTGNDLEMGGRSRASSMLHTSEECMINPSFEVTLECEMPDPLPAAHFPRGEQIKQALFSQRRPGH